MPLDEQSPPKDPAQQQDTPQQGKPDQHIGNRVRDHSNTLPQRRQKSSILQ